MSRRLGRWAYNSESTRYGVAGWHLDGSPVVIDFMPGFTDGAPARGMYLVYNWPNSAHIDADPVATHVQDAMRAIEREWDSLLLSALAGKGVPR